MTTKIVLAALAVCFIALASAAATGGPIDGKYFSATCESATGYFGVGGYGKRAWTFDAVKYVLRYEHYTDSSCENMDFIVMAEGFVNYGGEVVTNIVNLNMERFRPMIIPLNDASVLSFNMVCGGGFQISTPYDASNLNCPTFGFTPVATCPMIYSIARLTGTVLQIGIPTGVCSVAGRSTDLDTARSLNAVAGTMPSLQGVWAADCLAGMRPSSSYKSMVELDEEDYHLKWVLYNGATCDPTTVLAMFYTTGTYFISDHNAAISDGYNIQYVTTNSKMFLLNDGPVNFLQRNVFNGTTCPYIQVNASVPIDVTNIRCPFLGIASVSSCPVLYDVVVQRTNYITPYLQMGLMTGGDRTAGCSPASRPTAVNALQLYNTLPSNTQSLISAPVAVAVILSFVLGGALFGLLFGLCCRRWALNRGAKLATSE